MKKSMNDAIAPVPDSEPPDHRDTLRRINNQRSEYSTHSFCARGIGLEDFSVLFARFKNFNAEQIVPYLDLIDEMRIGYADCIGCSGKILAFCELFAKHKLQERYAAYRAEYKKLSGRQPKRNYRDEVQSAIQRFVG